MRVHHLFPAQAYDKLLNVVSALGKRKVLLAAVIGLIHSDLQTIAHEGKPLPDDKAAVSFFWVHHGFCCRLVPKVHDLHTHDVWRCCQSCTLERMEVRDASE